MAAYASEDRAVGFCDRCGQRYKLSTLAYEVVNKVRTGMRVCTSCFDTDHPQLQTGLVRTDDPQSLRDPRPDSSLTESRTITGTTSLLTYAKY